MTIHERIKPCDISNNEYDKFLSNDRELARKYAFNLGIYSKNKAEVILENIGYRLGKRKLEEWGTKENEFIIELVCKYPIDLRVDKLLSDILGVSRGKIKSMHKEGIVFIEDDKNSLNIKVRDEMKIHVLREVDSIDVETL